jgi:eukaryotic-like serine/threonine-protein kinase
MRIRRSFVSISIFFGALILSCSDRDDPTSGQNTVTAEASLLTSAGSPICSSYGIGGIYEINKALNSTHSIGAKINVTKTGTYIIHTDTVNGFSFKGQGTFTKSGEQNVILAGQGTPVLPGANEFKIKFGSTSCQLSINVQDKTDYSSRIILATGQVHMASNYTVYAFDGNKKILWRKSGYSDIPAVNNGVAYLTINGNVQAVDILTGAVIWENATLSSFDNAIAFHDNKLYISGRNGYIYGVDATSGGILWQYFSGLHSMISSSPTVVDNVIYVGGNGGKVFALNLNGTEKKVYAIAGVTSSVRSSPVVKNNILYFGNDNGYLYAVRVADGTVVWSRIVGAGGEQSPTIADGKLYIMGTQKLFCLNELTGDIIWEYAGKNGDHRWSSPFVKNGVLFASGMGNGLQTFNASTGKELWDNHSSGQSASMDPVVMGNHVYITGAGGISAIHATSGTTLWNYGYMDPSNLNNTVVYYTPAVVYDRLTKEVAYPSTSGNVQ